MLEPTEGELARPPIYNNAQEEDMAERPGEGRDDSLAGVEAGVNASSTSDETLAPCHTRHGNGDVEQVGDEKITIVGFESGNGEDPKEWASGKKW